MSRVGVRSFPTILVVALLLVYPTAARANCAKKSVMLHEAVVRLRDIANSSDGDQRSRDAERIHELSDAIIKEDCVGIAKQNQELVTLATAASVIIMSSADFP